MASTKMVLFDPYSTRHFRRTQGRSFDPDSFDFAEALAKLASKTTKFSMASDLLASLPQDVLRSILGLLLVSTKPLILGVDVNEKISNGLHPAILQTSHYVHNIGIEILYSCNTFTTSSPATSVNFDNDLLKLPGKTLQLIRHVKLEIDWADTLWAKFPLIARVLGSIQGLKSLKIKILPEPQDRLAKVPGNVYPREGVNGQTMLKVEQKVMIVLVLGLHALK